MSESIKCILEVYSSPTFSISSPKRRKAGVVGDDITFTINTEAVGSYVGNVNVTVSGAPTGAVVTYTPSNHIVAVGSPVTIGINTDACSEAVTTLIVSGA